VFRCVGRIITIFAICCAIGLQWIALQSVAWTTMVFEYSKHAPLCRAIAQTFDGAHPCALCQVVNKGKNSEKQSGLQSPTSSTPQPFSCFLLAVMRRRFLHRASV
jgi:hypothetical protein